MKRIVAFLLLVSCASTAPAGDDWWDEFWHGIHVGYYRNNAWPDPFNEADARDVIAPFEVMKMKGWKMNNTIGHEQFRSGDGALLASGNNKVHWIATKAPATHRTVYVLRGGSKAETDARVASVRESLANFYFEGPRPTVLVTDVAPPEASGAWANKISRNWLEQLPAPKLPNSSSSGAQGITTPTGGGE